MKVLPFRVQNSEDFEIESTELDGNIFLGQRHQGSSKDFSKTGKARRQDDLLLSGLLAEQMLLEIADKDSPRRSC